jgi:chromosome segregation ATPase
VSPRTINHAKAAHEAGLGEAVIAGEMTLKQADAQIKAARRPPTDAEAAESDGASGEVQPVKPFSLSHSDEQSSAHHSAANKESIEAILAERDEAREQAADLATELAEAKAELDAFHAAEIGEGEKQLVAANRRVLKLEAEVRRLEDRRDALMNENAELKREVKRLRRGLGMKANG